MKNVFTKNLPHPQSSKMAAVEIADILKKSGNFSVFLEGGLGVGKTFFVREILRQLEVSQEITSPTYTYVNEYKSKKQQEFAHFDFYRFESPNAFFEKGFQDIAEDDTVSCFAEWKDKISKEAQSTFSGKKFVIRVSFGVGAGMRRVKFIEV